MNSTPLLLETISIKQGEIQNIIYHNQRFNKSRREVFGVDSYIDLGRFISLLDCGDYRCRVIYGRDIESIEYLPYRPKDIKKILLVDSDIEYRYKYLNRSKLNNLLKKYDNYCDDILIIRDGLITDTTIANVALRREGKWYTPKKPLLEGTTRRRLIDSGFLSTQDIDKNYISDYDSFAIMNAMIDFKIININCLNIDDTIYRK
jgi:4-amino-4-deoxychorismate lyase